MKLSAQHIQVAITTLSDSLCVSNWHGGITKEARTNAMNALQSLITNTELEVTLSESKDANTDPRGDK
jgi:hypothetical protein